MKIITFMRPDGGLTIVNPCIGIQDPPDFTEEDAVARAMKDIPPDAIDVQIRESTDLPGDTTFRNAWKHEGPSVGHDMAKCRDIWRNKMRAVRAPLLVDLDQKYLRADEDNAAAEKRNISLQKKLLRNITDDPAIDSAQDVDALKLVWPAALGQKPEGL